MCPIGGRLLFYRAGSAAAQRRLVCQCLLIETDRYGLVLVDTGFGLRDVEQPAERLAGFFRLANGIRLHERETAVRQIERMGYEASDVRHIVLTHLDFDHAGGLDDFPHATVHMLANEYDYALQQKTLLDRMRFRPQQWGTRDKWRTYSERDG